MIWLYDGNLQTAKMKSSTKAEMWLHNIYNIRFLIEMWNGKHNHQNSNNGYKTSKKTFRHSIHTVTDISLFSIRFFDDLSSAMILIVLCSRYGYILASKPSTKSVLEKNQIEKRIMSVTVCVLCLKIFLDVLYPLLLFFLTQNLVKAEKSLLFLSKMTLFYAWWMPRLHSAISYSRSDRPWEISNLIAQQWWLGI